MVNGNIMSFQKHLIPIKDRLKLLSYDSTLICSITTWPTVGYNTACFHDEPSWLMQHLDARASGRSTHPSSFPVWMSTTLRWRSEGRQRVLLQCGIPRSSPILVTFGWFLEVAAGKSKILAYEDWLNFLEAKACQKQNLIERLAACFSFFSEKSWVWTCFDPKKLKQERHLVLYVDHRQMV